MRGNFHFDSSVDSANPNQPLLGKGQIVARLYIHLKLLTTTFPTRFLLADDTTEDYPADFADDFLCSACCFLGYVNFSLLFLSLKDGENLTPITYPASGCADSIWDFIVHLASGGIHDPRALPCTTHLQKGHAGIYIFLSHPTYLWMFSLLSFSAIMSICEIMRRLQ